MTGFQEIEWTDNLASFTGDHFGVEFAESDSLIRDHPSTSYGIQFVRIPLN